MKEDLSELRKTAEAATPGPWEFVEGDEAFGVRSSFGSLTWDDHSGEVFKEEDAVFIATFDPPTVLALLSRLEQAEQAVARVREVAKADLKCPCCSGYEEILRTLDGDALRCLECDGTGVVQVRFNHGIQTQDCAICFGTGGTRG